MEPDQPGALFIKYRFQSRDPLCELRRSLFECTVELRHQSFWSRSFIRNDVVAHFAHNINFVARRSFWDEATGVKFTGQGRVHVLFY